MKKINLNSNLLVSGGLVVLGLAQALLSNKKQADDMAKLEEKVAEKVMKNLAGQKQD